MKSLKSILLAPLTGVALGNVVRRDTVPMTMAPCAQVSSSASAQLMTSPSATPTVAAQLAYDCLTSVDLAADQAVQMVEGILPYVEWESDLTYLAAPPSGYLMPAIDIRAALQNITSNIKSGLYQHEHAFQTDLLKVFQSVHNGHFRYAPDLLSKVILFRRPVSVVSVSEDGVSVPKIYIREDIENHVVLNGTSMPSAITQVNGQEAVAFMTELANLGFMQDPDALYNNLFFEKAFDAGYERYTGFFALAGRYGYFYPGANTTLQFDNGTLFAYENYAEIQQNLTGIVDGPTFFQKFCTGPHLVTSTLPDNFTIPTPVPPSVPPTATVPAYGYPTPMVISSDDQASGYFLEGTGYDDVAVLSLLSFEPSWPIEFQSVIQTTISMARAAGKTKIIIDLSANGGGIILTGYDTFRQFFPQITQDGFSRFRYHQAFDNIGQGVSNYASNFTPSSNSPEDYFAYQSALNYRYDLNQTNGTFRSVDDKFGPEKWNGDNYTKILRWNMEDPVTTTNLLWGLGETITGYGDRANFTQPFAAEDIILLYDGYCASTCTIFSEFMQAQGNVKSIAMGGRPNTNPIQAIGGTKGANNFPFSYIRQLAILANSTASPTQLEAWQGTLDYSEYAINRSLDSSINVRDAINRVNLADGTPAQFVYQEADCRLFYEPGMITDVRNIWKKVADVAWNGGMCVSGGLAKRSETKAERKRKSEEMMIRARSENRTPVRRALNSMLAGKLGPGFGKKVPL